MYDKGPLTSDGFSSTLILAKTDFKGELQSKMTLMGMKEDLKTNISSIFVFKIDPQLKEISHLIQNLVLLGRSSGGKRKKFGRSSRGKRKRFGRSFEGKWKSFFHFPPQLRPVLFLFRYI